LQAQEQRLGADGKTPRDLVFGYSDRAFADQRVEPAS
jgi:hypothetical protein